MYIEERGWVSAQIHLTNCWYIKKFRFAGIIYTLSWVIAATMFFFQCQSSAHLFSAHSFFTFIVFWGRLGTSIFGNSSSAANNTRSRLPSRPSFCFLWLCINIQLYSHVNYFHFFEFTWLACQHFWQSFGMTIPEMFLAEKNVHELKITCIFAVQSFHVFMY